MVRHIWLNSADDRSFPSAAPGFGVFDNLTAFLLGPYLGKGIDFFMDRKFGRLTIAAWLLSKGSRCTCTISHGSKFIPAELKWAEREKEIDHISSRQSGEMTVMRWKSKQSRSVMIVTTMAASEVELKKIKRKVDGK